MTRRVSVSQQCYCDFIATMKTTSLISLCLAVTTCGLIATEIDAFAPAKFSSPSRSIVSRTRPLLMADPVGIGESLSNAWASYNDALEANPLLVKSVTASFILGAADLAGQTIEQKQRGDEDTNIDIARVARFATFGLVLQAPWNHFYYQLLDGALPPTPDPWTETTAVKTFIDQFVQAPIFTVLIFGFLGFLDGKNAQDIKQQLDDDYKDTMFANWKLWVPATVINLAFVPPLFRVLYLNCVFFFWSIFLSLKLNKGK